MSAVRRRALRTGLLVAAAGLVPWSIQVYDGGDSFLLFAWGVVGVQTGHVVLVTDYFLRYTAGTPGYVSAWPLATLLWLGALASALLPAVLGRRDPRVTAGLLALSGVAQVARSRGFAVQPTRTAYPTGTVVCLLLAAVVWWLAAPHRYS